MDNKHFIILIKFIIDDKVERWRSSPTWESGLIAGATHQMKNKQRPRSFLGRGSSESFTHARFSF